MAKINFDLSPATLKSVAVEIREMITKPAKYIFEVIDARLLDSGTNPDGSEKKFQPVYVDRTPDIYLVLRDVVSGKIHIHRMALSAYHKFREFSAADVKDNKLSDSGRDGYALLTGKDGKLHRIPCKSGEAYEAVVNIFSKFVTSLGLEEGTTPDECDSMIGRHFKGTLKSESFTSNPDEDGMVEEKTRLKLASNFEPVSEEDLKGAIALNAARAAFIES